MFIEQALRNATAQAVQQLFGDNNQINPNSVTINQTPEHFTGDFSVVVFPYVRMSRLSPEQTAQAIGQALQAHFPFIESFNTVKGFLNLTFSDEFWFETLKSMLSLPQYGVKPATGKKIVLEYIGPNTNKPLHLGHIRNILIGYAMANILAANGHTVHKVTIYNDRGIAICKSMIAWLKTAKGATPESTKTKGDHFVGNYYVAYANLLQEQISQIVQEQGITAAEAEKIAPLAIETQEMLRKWEADDPQIRDLWQTMNNWVYEGFFETYKLLGCDYEKPYYESDTYLVGQFMVERALQLVIPGFFKRPDGAIAVDLTDMGLDEKILIRKDGTTIYITQDMGVAQIRYSDYHMDQSIYVVAVEQDYHFKALKAVLQKMGLPYAQGIYHLSYGMVDLPTGRMKSREGTVVDADDLLDTMYQTAKEHTQTLGKTHDMSETEANKLFWQLALGALKYFMLKINAQKRMVFNPQESIDFLGNTGPFIQYACTRINSLQRKYGQPATLPTKTQAGQELHATERDLIKQFYFYAQAIADSGNSYDPSVVANYLYNLAKTFNRFYNEVSILNAPTPELIQFRMTISAFSGKILKHGLGLLGIEVPDRM